MLTGTFHLAWGNTRQIVRDRFMSEVALAAAGLLLTDLCLEEGGQPILELVRDLFVGDLFDPGGCGLVSLDKVVTRHTALQMPFQCLGGLDIQGPIEILGEEIHDLLAGQHPRLSLQEVSNPMLETPPGDHCRDLFSVTYRSSIPRRTRRAR